jgi:hypothetical protein
MTKIHQRLMKIVKHVIILFQQEGWPMKNSLDEIIKERLENRLEWKNYLGWLITHRQLHMNAKKKFYEDKPFLNLILKLYFLPYNTMKYFIYRCDCHKFEMIETEIKMLKKVRGNQDEQS